MLIDSDLLDCILVAEVEMEFVLILQLDNFWKLVFESIFSIICVS